MTALNLMAVQNNDFDAVSLLPFHMTFNDVIGCKDPAAKEEISPWGPLSPHTARGSTARVGGTPEAC